MNSHPKTLNTLQALVIEESLCLKSGNFQILTDIISKKSKILSQLEWELSNPELKTDMAYRVQQLRQVRQKLKDNSVLMRAAINGLKSAQNRLEALRRMDNQTGTYNRLGKPVEISYKTGVRNKFI